MGIYIKVKFLFVSVCGWGCVCVYIKVNFFSLGFQTLAIEMIM